MTFEVQVEGDGPVRYQWLKNGNNISGAVDRVYLMQGTTSSHDGTYQCVISNDWGSVTSDWASLTVVNAPVPTNPPIRRRQ